VRASLLVLAVAALALTLTHRAPRAPLGPKAAIADALRSEQVDRALAGTHWSRVQSTPLDGSLERVTFFSGGQTVATVAVRSDGSVDQLTGGESWGDWIAYEPAVLACLGALFVLMLAVIPIARVRNVDVLGGLAMIPALVLFQRRYVDASVIAALPAVCYFAARCAWRGLAGSSPPKASQPLFDYVTVRLSAEQRVRLLRLTFAAIALVLVMVVVSSPGPVDVAYAVMEGATKLVHGVLPYGHMPGDVVHGDTYPILSYALYAPAAWISPVSSVFSSVDAALAVTAIAAIATAGLVGRLAAASVSRSTPASSGEAAGLRAAIAVLAFPSLFVTASTGTTDVLVGAMLALALVLWRRPAASAGVLAIAAWFKLAPALLAPIWLASRRGRALASSCLAMLVVSAASIGLVLGLGGPGGAAAMVHAVAFQFGRQTVSSPWIVLGVPGLQPIAEAAVLALLAGATVRVWRDPTIAADTPRLAALGAAVLLCVQLAAEDWTFLYLAWVLPLVTLALLADLVPATTTAADGSEELGSPLAAPALVVGG
jgi:hypothetical protein